MLCYILCVKCHDDWKNFTKTENTQPLEWKKEENHTLYELKNLSISLKNYSGLGMYVFGY